MFYGLPRMSMALILGAGLAAAAPSGEDDLVTRLQHRYDRLRDLRADFVQSFHSGMLGAEEPERGSLVVARPGRMRWDYTSAERKLAVIGPERSWIYFPAEKVVDCHRTDEALDDSPVAALLTGEVDLRAAFLVEVVPGAARETTIRLRPRELSDEFEEALLTVSPRSLVPRRLVVVDPLGNRMEYVFENVRENQGVAEDLFTPALPGDVAWNGDCPPEQGSGP